jgi:ElaB/YqjD/DUF883 family membrane-anchored ribosome-binding protein
MDDDFEKVKERAKRFAEEAGETVKEKLGSFQDSAEWEDIRRTATSLAKEAGELMRKYPVQSVLGAAAVGFVLGTLLGRRR